MWSPFVDPAVVRLPLTHHQWIDVKRELTYGETEDMYARMRRQFGPNEPPTLDPTRIGRARMSAFIVAWSFVDPSGTPVPVSEAAFADLKPAIARDESYSETCYCLFATDDSAISCEGLYLEWRARKQ